MPKEGKALLAAYDEAVFEGHNPDVPWAGRDAQGWLRLRDELYPTAKVLPVPKPAKTSWVATKPDKKKATKKK